MSPMCVFMADISQRQIPRVPGTAVFLTRTKQDVPPVMVWHLSHNRALHQRLLVLTADTESVPWVNDAGRLDPTEWRSGLRVVGHFTAGIMCATLVAGTEHQT
jgi:KUP system potassium uptake protein